MQGAELDRIANCVLQLIGHEQMVIVTNFMKDRPVHGNALEVPPTACRNRRIGQRVAKPAILTLQLSSPSWFI
jgi:hypothetical protein